MRSHISQVGYRGLGQDLMSCVPVAQVNIMSYTIGITGEPGVPVVRFNAIASEPKVGPPGSQVSASAAVRSCMADACKHLLPCEDLSLHH